MNVVDQDHRGRENKFLLGWAVPLKALTLAKQASTARFLKALEKSLSAQSSGTSAVGVSEQSLHHSSCQELFFRDSEKESTFHLL